MEYTFKFTEGDRVSHVKEPDAIGIIQEVDRNIPDPTTCVVLWNDGFKGVHWTNKLVNENVPNL
jgi:hypothetical protein